MKRDGRARIVLCSTVLVLVVMAGQTMAALVRGPYLQNGTTEGVTIMWRTSSNVSSKVWYGTSLGALNQMVTDATLETNHTIRISGLPPASKYYYQVGMTNGTVLAGGDADHYFVTSPVAGSTDPFRIWVLGDCGMANNNARAVRDAYLELADDEKETDIWLMLGDNAYNSGTDSEYQAAVFDTYPEILRNKVLWSTRGNHEMSSSVYYGIFDHPTQGEGGGLASGTESYYSFDYGNVHFICLNSQESNLSSNPSSAMYQWLEQDLADTTQDWIIAFWHHPPYTKGSHNSDNAGDSGGRMVYIRQNALPILEAGGVDMVLTGHSHSYERSYFLNGHYGSSGSFDSNTHVVQAGDGREDGDGAYQKCGTDGAVYIVAGSSGKLGGGSLNHPAKLVSLNNLGSLIIDVNNSKLDSRFLRETTGPTRIDDYFTIEFESCIVDETAPTPDPMEWLTVPYATGTTSISMTATMATDDNFAVQYFFECTVGNGHDSGWQDSPTYVDTRLVPSSQYTYRVKARDKSSNYNETGWSSEMVGITDLDFPNPGDFNRDGFVNLLDFGILGLQWSKNDCDTNDFWCNFADMDLSTAVDAADLSLFTSYWLEEYAMEDSEMLAFDDFDSYPLGRSIFSLSNWYSAGDAEVSTNGIGGSQGCTPDQEFFVWSAGDGSINEFNWMSEQSINHFPVLMTGDTLIFSMDFEFTAEGFVQESVGFTIFPTWFYNYYYSVWDLSFTISLSDYNQGSGYAIEGAWSRDWGENSILTLAALPDPTVGTWYRLRAAFTKLEVEIEQTEEEIEAEEPVRIEPALSIIAEVWQLDENGKKVSLFGTATPPDTSKWGIHRPNPEYFNPNFGLWPIYRNVSPGGCDNAYFGYIPAEVVVEDD